MSSRAQCEAALRLFRSALLEFRNVVDVGIVPRAQGAPGKENLAVEPDLAVAVYVRRKIPLDELDPDDVLPAYLQVRDNVSLF